MLHEDGLSTWTPDERERALALIQEAMPLARRIAASRIRPGVDMEDLQGEAELGLVMALQSFDPSRGVPFKSYAAWWVRALVMRYLQNQASELSLGNSRATRRLFFQLGKERAWLARHGLPDGDAEVALAIGVTVEEIASFDNARLAPVLPLHLPVRDGEGLALEERVAGEQGDPETAVASAQQQRCLKELFDCFAETLRSPRERVIWEERLRTADPVSQSELGRRFGVSKQRVGQIETALRHRLEQWVRRQGLWQDCCH